jgi:hypothetical protein
MNNETTNTASAISLSEIDGETRVRDVDIGEKLGFAEPRMIRNLIKRHLASLNELGVCYAVEQTAGAAGGRPSEVFYLNKRQAVFITAKSETPKATETTIEVIQRFDDYESGRIAFGRQLGARDVHITFRSFHAIGRMIGLIGNEAALAANRATVKMTGVDALQAMGATHLIAAKQEELLTATMIGQRLDGISAKAVNKRLEALGFHEGHADSRGNHGWHPTEKGLPFGLWLDTSKSHRDGTSVRQWKWTADIIREIQAGAAINIVAGVAAGMSVA